MKPKVLVIFPRFDNDDGSHYPYWYRQFEEAGKTLDLVILFEQSNGIAHLKNCTSITQKYKLKPINLIERVLLVLYFRLQGYKNIYIHYSYFSLFIAKIITALLGGKTFLWDCEYYEMTPVNKWQIRAIKLTDVLVTGHKVIADQYRKVLNLGNKPIEVVWNWVDRKSQKSSFFALSEHRKGRQVKNQNNKINVLFVHHLAPRKGSRDLPGIITGVLDKRNDVQFTIVGDGPDYQLLKSWVLDNHLETKVIIKGKLSRKQTDEEFAKADLFIMPSRSEGFPRVILEAQSWGLPYVVTDVGCVREITPKQIQDLLIVPLVSAMSERVLNFINIDETKGKGISNSIKKNSLNYSLDFSTKQFAELF